MALPIESPHPAIWMWKGVHTSGAPVQGHMRAGGPSHVCALLRRQGVQVQHLRRSRWRQVWSRLHVALLGYEPSTTLPTRELATFMQQWAALLQAGIPLLASLDILAQTAPHARFSLVLRLVASDLQKGTRLCHALRHHPQAFDALTCDLIEAAESAGALAPVLHRLAEDHERKLALQQKVRAALMYPLTVLAVALGVIGVVLTWVVPAFEEVYQSLGGELPWATRGLVILAQQCRARAGAIVCAIFSVGCLTLKQWHRHPAFRSWVAWHTLRLPVWGELLTCAAVSRWARTLGTLLAAGVPLAEALPCVAPACGHSVFTEATVQSRHEVSQGQPLSEGLRRTGVFPDLVVRLVAVGEESGGLEAMLLRVAHYHEEALDASSKRLAAALEPLLIVVMGAIVGAAVLALYWPMFNLGAAI